MGTLNLLTYEWDRRKEATNIKEHGVSFHESSTVFLDPLSMSFYDPDHSDDEDRFITLGIATTGKLLFISHTADLVKSIRHQNVTCLNHSIKI